MKVSVGLGESYSCGCGKVSSVRDSFVLVNIEEVVGSNSRTLHGRHETQSNKSFQKLIISIVFQCVCDIVHFHCKIQKL